MRAHRIVSAFAFILFLTVFAAAQKDRSKIEINVPKDYKPFAITASPDLRAILNEAVDAASGPRSGKAFKPHEIAATLIDLRDASHPLGASVNGDRPIYPASVVKMFYMAALERQLEDGKVMMTKELERGLRDMIVVSSNEATQYILDVLTDTASGGEMPEKDFRKWQYKRDRVNRYFSSMGYRNINVNQKTFCEDAYGIEQQSRQYKGANRNMITTDATARLMAEIVTGRLNTPQRTSVMMDLMKRDPFAKTNDADDQSVGFTGKALLDGGIRDAKLWSKAGWTSRARHDVAYIETADGLRFVLAVFTENHANDRDVIPAVATAVINRLRTLK